MCEWVCVCVCVYMCARTYKCDKSKTMSWLSHAKHNITYYFSKCDKIQKFINWKIKKFVTYTRRKIFNFLKFCYISSSIKVSVIH